MNRTLRTALGIAALAATTQVGAEVTVYPYTTSDYPYTRPDVASADQLYEARVISSRPVSGATKQQCWMERQQIGPLELPGVLIGGTIDLLTGRPQSTPYIERCAPVATTAYWDVTYEFRGVIRHAELSRQDPRSW